MTYSAAMLGIGLALALPQPARAADDAALSAQANQAYVAANAKRNGVITLPDGLQYRVLQNGTGRHPGLTDTAQLYFAARLINGALFDGTSPGLPVSLAVNSVIRGLSEALQRMRVGDHWQLVIPSGLGFGSKGAGNGIVPANQTLVFDVTLLSATPAPLGGVDQSATLSILSSDREHGAVLTIHP